MDQALILETSFLIDFERERIRGTGPTLDFLEDHSEHNLYITHTIAGEMACGASMNDPENWKSFLQPFGLLNWTLDVDWQYARIFRFLQRQGRLIGANDLWIAAAGLAYRCPVVTSNVEHFQRVPDLTVIPYRHS